MSDSLKSAIDLACDMTSGLLYIKLDKLRDEPGEFPLPVRASKARALLEEEQTRLLGMGQPSDQIETALRALTRVLTRHRDRRISDAKKAAATPKPRKQEMHLVFQHIEGESRSYGVVPIIAPTPTRYSVVVAARESYIEAVNMAHDLTLAHTTGAKS